MDQTKVPSPRTPLVLDVNFRKSYARDESTGTLLNISIGGAFLEFNGEALREGEKLQLRFVVSGRERKVPAVVIWSNNKGAGVKFVPANNRDIQIVDDLIYFVESSRTDRRSVLDNIFKKVG